jgi:hypothetical protein
VLRERFRTPQRVVFARGPWLRLADGLVVSLLGSFGSREDVDRFNAWVSANLVGRDVRVVLPDRVKFDNAYVPGMITGLSNLRPKDPETGTPYGNVPAIVLLDGEIVNLRISKNAERDEKWFRDQVAKNM